MSLAQAKQVFSFFCGTVEAVRGVGQHIVDDVYRGLGITQAACMVGLTTAWLIVMFPENGLTPIGDAYAAMYNVTKKELNSPQVSHALLNYAIWLIGGVLSMRVGEKIGKGVWGVYCRVRTGCKSSHTMDLPLSTAQRERVIHNLLPSFIDSPEFNFDRISKGEAQAKCDEVIHWVHKALLFYSMKNQRDKKRGKMESAEGWWTKKKLFRQDCESIKLYQTLKLYHNKLQERKIFVMAYTRFLSSHLTGTGNMDKSQLLLLVKEVLSYFQPSVVIRHQRRYNQAIYKDYVAVRKSLNKLTFEHSGSTAVQEAVIEVIAVLKRAHKRLDKHQKGIPSGPPWLQNVLDGVMKVYYKEHSIVCTSGAAREVASDVSNISEADRDHHIEVLAGLFKNGVTSGVAALEEHSGFDDPELEHRIDHQRISSGESVSRLHLLELPVCNKV